MESVKYGANHNHLTFNGYIPRKDPNLLYCFDFIGTEITVSTYLPDEAKRQLLDALVKDYGYAPYDIKKARKVFGGGKDYQVNSVAG